MVELVVETPNHLWLQQIKSRPNLILPTLEPLSPPPLRELCLQSTKLWRSLLQFLQSPAPHHLLPKFWEEDRQQLLLLHLIQKQMFSR